MAGVTQPHCKAGASRQLKPSSRLAAGLAQHLLLPLPACEGRSLANRQLPTGAKCRALAGTGASLQEDWQGPTHGYPVQTGNECRTGQGWQQGSEHSTTAQGLRELQRVGSPVAGTALMHVTSGRACIAPVGAVGPGPSRLGGAGVSSRLRVSMAHSTSKALWSEEVSRTASGTPGPAPPRRAGSPWGC